MTTVPHFTVADSAEDPDADIWFAEPAGFTAVPLDALLPPPGSPATDDLRAVLTPLLQAAPDEPTRQRFIAQLAQGQQLLGALREEGTVHCSIGLHRDDVGEDAVRDGRPLLSFFTVSWRATAVAPRAVTAARAVTGLDTQTRVEYIELPCGPVTFSENVLAPRAVGGLPRTPLIQFRAHLPHPDCKRLAVFTLSAAAVDRRDQYRAVLRQIATLATFDNPLRSASPEAS
ncbi:hypothetical protein [Streptomyces triticiradicis]|uniref:Uncharacterized protein n=1 Tax=Streptomyces triticiradicis TaxID=2651189 RepID=A0A7J5D1Z2_9ACTN|nr:hypothetical protein [Streptomyces triticiradicis]KAB1977257.1 hypothetical protein F8144_42455 [Streptomyces triticiradicis]